MNNNNEENYPFKWYDICPENPFNKKILDIRSFTGTVTATTKDENIAKSYSQLRNSNGEYLKNESILNAEKADCQLIYPHNGSTIEGIVFKAESMDCKWDIYAYDHYFLFARSWTGELVYKVKFEITQDSLILNTIIYPKDLDADSALSDIHYLLQTHVLNQPIPHKIPKELTTEKEIALWSFSKFGNRAYYATYENVYDTEIRTN